ncbi:MAG: hypothetical protein WBO68_05985, partial [Pyrinomonadaceae bacterium]
MKLAWARTIREQPFRPVINSRNEKAACKGCLFCILVSRRNEPKNYEPIYPFLSHYLGTKEKPALCSTALEENQMNKHGISVIFTLLSLIGVSIGCSLWGSAAKNPVDQLVTLCKDNKLNEA